MADFSAEDLREIESLTRSIGKYMDVLSDKSDKRNKKLATELNTLKSITSELNSEEDIQKALEGLERRRGVILKSNYGINQNLKEELIDQNKFATQALNLELRRIKITQQVADAAREVGDSITSSIDGMKSQIQQIPLIGNVFAKIFPADTLNKTVTQATTNFTKGFSTMFKRNLSQGKGFIQSFGSGMKGGMAGISKAIAPLLANPYALAAIAATAFLSIGLVAFYKITEAAKAFRDETGLLNSQTEHLTSQINQVYMNTSRLGASMEDVAKAAADFTNEFEGIETPSDEVLNSMVILNKNFGIATGDAAKLNKQFQTMSGLSSEQAQSLINSTVSMADMANVAPSKVIKDLADNSSKINLFFRGSAEELAKAAVKAAALGTSMGQLSDIAENLLDFESSITKELELGALFGRNINLSKARALAFDGDSLGMQKELIKQVSTLGNLQNISYEQKKALQDLTGQDITQLQRQVDIYNKFGDLREDELAAAQSLLDTGKDINKITKADLDAQNEVLAKQRETQSAFDNMKNEASAIFDELMQALMPVGKLVIDIIVPMFSILRGSFKPIAAAMNNIMDAVNNLLAPFKEIFGEGSGEGLKTVLEVIGSLIRGPLMFSTNLLAGIINSIANVFGGIVKVIKGFLSGDMKMVADGIYSIFEGILSRFLRVPIAIYDTIVGIFPKIDDFFSSLTSRIKQFFMDMLPGWAQKLLGGSMSSSVDTTDGLEPAGSVGDGVIQAGKIITTDPKDFIIATKNPGELSEGSVMSELISEIKGLRNDLNSGKIGVYMDGTAVASKISKVVDRIGVNSYS